MAVIFYNEKYPLKTSLTPHSLCGAFLSITIAEHHDGYTATVYRILTVIARPQAAVIHVNQSCENWIATLHPLGVSPTSLSGYAAKSVEMLAMTVWMVITSTKIFPSLRGHRPRQSMLQQARKLDCHAQLAMTDWYY
jgi:hypothetical protein